MKKLFLFLAMAVVATVSYATDYRIVCCDGSVHTVYSVGTKILIGTGGWLQKDVDQFKQQLAESTCVSSSGCYRSITEIPGTGAWLIPATPQEQEYNIMFDYEKLLAKQNAESSPSPEA